MPKKEVVNKLKEILDLAEKGEVDSFACVYFKRPEGISWANMDTTLGELTIASTAMQHAAVEAVTIVKGGGAVKVGMVNNPNPSQH